MALGIGCGSGSGDDPNGAGGQSSGGATTGGASGSGTGGASTSGGVTGGAPQTGGATSTAGTATGGSTAAGTSSGGSSGTAGSGGAGTGGGGITDPATWPNDMSRANSDDWLSANHDRITQLKPKVLVIDLENTSNAEKLITDHINALKLVSTPHGFKDKNAQPAVAYELVSVVHATKGSGRIDYNSWNSRTFADENMKLKDPANPTGPNLTLCEAFEKGVINEVWCMAGSDPKCGETQEAKQVYDATGKKVAGKFVSASNGDNIMSLGCKVTARITDFNSKRGTGCHQHAMGHAWERYMDAGAVPTLAKQAKRFLNWDMDKRYGAPFSSFYQACSTVSAQTTDCMTWVSDVHVKSGASASKPFDITDISQGCGNSHFYPNTTGNYSYDARTPDPEVSSACENYGLGNGEGGKDLTTKYTNAMTDKLYPQIDDDCGGHGSAYLYQNFPGPGTLAKNDDGTPMRNWWVYLFY